MFIEWGSFVIVCVAALAIGAGLGSTSQLRVVRNLVIAGALMRIVGVFARHAMIFDLYSGISDAVGYFGAGRLIAEQFRAFDFSIIGSGHWGDREWGTQAVRYISGLVLTVVGPSVRGGFLAFSLAAFIGLACVAIAFGRAGRTRSMTWCVLALFFWPTLWFWPSSMGKEAVLLLAVGLVTLGYVGRNERIHWIPLVAGLGLAMAIRPHLAGVLAVSACAAEWFARDWTSRRLVQSLLASALMLWLLVVAFGMLGLSGADSDALEAYVLQTAKQTNIGGSSFDRSDSFVVAVPMAFLNILCRPFITEVHSPMALASSLEMMAFWGIVLVNRRNLRAVLRSWRVNRLLRFAVPFSLLYILMLGLTFQNSGIIARQRTLVMPMLLVVLTAVPVGESRRASTGQTRRTWRSPASKLSVVSAGSPS